MTGIRPMITLQGLPASQGVAIGRAVVIANRALEVFRIPIAAEETDAEVARLKAACSATQQQIQRTRAKASHLFGQELAAIFDAHSLLLSDRMFLDQVERRIVEEQVNAEWAVHETSRELASDSRRSRILTSASADRIWRTSVDSSRECCRGSPTTRSRTSPAT